MDVRVTVIDIYGKECDMYKDDFTTLTWNFMVDDIIQDLDCTPEPGPALLEIYSNFTMDGWMFLTNGYGFAGTNARLTGSDDTGQ